MSSVFSSSWYRVAALKPLLRGHFEVHRQPFRNELAFLLQDHSTGKFYRFNANAYDIIGRMDGEQTVHDIWEATLACVGDEAQALAQLPPFRTEAALPAARCAPRPAARHPAPRSGPAPAGYPAASPTALR